MPGTPAPAYLRTPPSNFRWRTRHNTTKNITLAKITLIYSNYVPSWWSSSRPPLASDASRCKTWWRTECCSSTWPDWPSARRKLTPAKTRQHWPDRPGNAVRLRPPTCNTWRRRPASPAAPSWSPCPASRWWPCRPAREPPGLFR